MTPIKSNRHGRLRRKVPGGGGDLLLQNLPSGFTLQSDSRFTNPLVNGGFVDGWRVDFNDVGWAVPGAWTGTEVIDSIRLLSDSSGGYGPNIARVQYSAGSDGGNLLPNHPTNGLGSGGTGAGGWIGPVLPANVREVYFAARVRFSSNYEMHTNPFVEKFWYPRFTTGYSPFQTPVVQFGGVTDVSNAPPYRIGTSWYDNSTGSINQHRSAAVLNRGEWYTIEIHQRINSYNAVRALADGFSKVWVNGALVLDIQNWRGALMSQQIYYESGTLFGTRGGGGSAILVPAGGMWRDIDRMALYYKVES